MSGIPSETSKKMVGLDLTATAGRVPRNQEWKPRHGQHSGTKVGSRTEAVTLRPCLGTVRCTARSMHSFRDSSQPHTVRALVANDRLVPNGRRAQHAALTDGHVPPDHRRCGQARRRCPARRVLMVRVSPQLQMLGTRWCSAWDEYTAAVPASIATPLRRGGDPPLRKVISCDP